METRQRYVICLIHAVCMFMVGKFVLYQPEHKTADSGSANATRRDGRAPRGSTSGSGSNTADSGDDAATLREEDFYYAPLVVGAGHGTTGTHFMAEATCQLGFASAHYAVGCLPKSAIVLAPSRSEACRRISSFGNYSNFFQVHWKLAKWTGQVNRGAEPSEVRDRLVALLEQVVLWGKRNRVAVALHDSPYPLLMPSILRLVRKHYGEKARPIVLLSEREPREWAQRRLEKQGTYRFCRPSAVAAQSGFANRTSLDGGAFDVVGCVDRALADRGNFTLPDILYNMKEANAAGELEFVVQAIDIYQRAIAAWEVFRYNMFNKGYRTEIEELSGRIREALIGALVKNDGTLRMKEGKGFRGLEVLGRGWGKSNGGDAQGGVLAPYEGKDSMKALANYPDMVPVNHNLRELMETMSRRCASNITKHASR